jgi:hypothetical protein
MGFIIQTAVLAKAPRRKGAKWWDLIFKDHQPTAAWDLFSRRVSDD